jgi:hypothetical protein
VRIPAALCLVALAAPGLLSGCTTTQQKSARAKVVANRLLASRKPMLVTRPSPDVKVESATLIRGRRGSAVVVRLRNLRPRVLEDLPISVGVRPRDWLNRRGGLDYLQTHVAAIAPRAIATWVFSTPRRVRAGRAFARVGIGSAVPPPRLPALRAMPATLSGGYATARVTNSSDIPQYGLGVYALSGGAAGRTVIRHLGTGDTTAVRIRLIGRPHGAAIHLEIAPSTLR